MRNKAWYIENEKLEKTGREKRQKDGMCRIRVKRKSSKQFRGQRRKMEKENKDLN